MSRGLPQLQVRHFLLVALSAAVWLVLGLLTAPGAWAAGDDPEDEILFYRDDGLFRYYDIKKDGSIPAPIQGGDGYTNGWSSIVAIDLDGGGQDEIFFYREDGLFRFYNIGANGSIGKPILSGDGYTAGWDAITALDMDGDGQDEMFFYRDDGLFRYYNIGANGSIGKPILSGDGYTAGWDAITALDMDGDGQDEMFFYRDDGLFRFYNVSASGALGQPILAGDGYTSGWTSIEGIELDGDQQDEIFFYRDDGLFRYYNISANGTLGTPLVQGSNYTEGWTVITPIQLQGDYTPERVSRFTTFFNCCESRVTNIRTMARAVDGTVVMPGETFSISEVVGPTTSSKGYVPAGYLVGGEGQCCAVGGGVSQFGTTIHNAVFWGGFDVVSHRPHSAWISRYPLGIEATLVYGSIDYKFTNDTVTPVTIRTSSTGSSVTVEIWGNQGGWQMSGFHPTGARTSRISILDRGGSAAKRVSGAVYGSAPGRVRIVRTLTEGGKSTSETWYWTYLN